MFPIPVGLPSAPALSTCLMHPTWAGDKPHLSELPGKYKDAADPVLSWCWQ